MKAAFELQSSCVCEKCSKIDTHKLVEYTGKISVVIFYTNMALPSLGAKFFEM